MNVLMEKFPKELEIQGKCCSIGWDFRTILSCNEMIEQCRNEITEGELLKILETFYKNCRHYTEEHVEKMFWFFSCGREKEKKIFPRKIAGINDKQPFDFEKDAELIYAGFQQQYGIDLQTTEMHWWRFMILLENLGEGTRLSKVIEYRTRDTSSKHLSKEERSFYKAMQQYYGLDRKYSKQEDEVLKKIEEALMKGEDITELLRGGE